MSCSNPQQKPDWNAYVLAELTADARRAAEAHAATCAACREELAMTRLTLDAMSTLREEEVPRRIAFVSDKVFEPRWWQMFLNPTFAAAALVAIAIVAHGFMAGGTSSEAIEAQVQSRVDAAVSKAMVQVSAQQQDVETQVHMQTGLLSQVLYEKQGLVRQ